MHQTWLDALAHNIANVNTVTRTDENAFQAQMVDRAARRQAAASTSPGIARQRPRGPADYDPDHPLADADGYVRAPEIDMASQMTQLVMAQRGFQASVQVTKNAQDTYSSALQIGRG